ncbi:hypothetical protein, partial [Brevibacillus agri]|uniref:hypothetical protein n=1 Tax=Brevibacillus agri TaxID=51101 RepID=UPI002867D934
MIEKKQEKNVRSPCPTRLSFFSPHNKSSPLIYEKSRGKTGVDTRISLGWWHDYLSFRTTVYALRSLKLLVT